MKKLKLVLWCALISTYIYAQGNTTIISQETNSTPNFAEVNQDGLSNVVKLIQEVKGNTATINQTGDRNILKNSDLDGSSDDFAKQRALSALILNQIGDDNVVGLFQNNQKNIAYVDQTGLNNNSDVWQQAFGGVVSGNETDIDQLGSNNIVKLKQKGDLNLATIDQNGLNNNSLINQDGLNIGPSGGLENNSTTLITGDNNVTSLYQFGNSNYSSIILKAAGNGETSSNNLVDVYQTGNENEIQLNGKRSDFNIVSIDQNGDNNLYRISFEGDMNNISIDLDGEHNQGDWAISSAWPEKANENTLSIVSDGLRNYATGRIDGNNNDVEINQTGEFNSVGISWYTRDGVVIEGNNNDVSVTQNSNNNSSFNSVIGNNNTISVLQN